MGFFTHSLNKEQMQELKQMATAIGKILDRGAENYVLSALAIEKLTSAIKNQTLQILELQKAIQKEKEDDTK